MRNLLVVSIFAFIFYVIVFIIHGRFAFSIASHVLFDVIVLHATVLVFYHYCYAAPNADFHLDGSDACNCCARSALT